MKETDASVVISTTRPSDTYCAFELHAQFKEGEPPEVIYVAATRLIDVFRLREAKMNSEFIKIFRKGGDVMVRIIATSNDKREVKRAAVARIHELDPTPRCNKHGYSVSGQQHPIKCSNGETYRSQKEAAEALGVSQGLISKHLSGEAAHVKGYTFVYASLITEKNNND